MFVNHQRCWCYANIPMNVFTIMNVVMIQHRMFYASISMNTSPMVAVAMTQRYKFCAGIPMNVFDIINALMVQRRRCCSFDSPGLARNEPTPGKRSQGDSTPSVLSFF